MASIPRSVTGRSKSLLVDEAAAVAANAALQAVFVPKLAKGLRGLGLETVGDLLRHYPRKYADPGKQIGIDELAVGEHVSVFAQVEHATVQANRAGGYRLEATVADAGHRLRLVFFGKRRPVLEARLAELTAGARGVFTGVVTEFQQVLQLAHPDYRMIGAGAGAGVGAADEDGLRYELSKPIPIYSASAGVRTWEIQAALREVWPLLPETVFADPVPPATLESLGLASRRQALAWAHAPETEADWRAARDRLRFEEAFVLQTALALRRLSTSGPQAQSRPRSSDPGSRLARFDAALPFTLTAGQVEIGEVVAAELADSKPMQRLVVGEVGSGKTVIALRAMLQVVDAGGQAVFLAPTEILAQQHAQTFAKLLGDLARTGFDVPADRVKVALLTGSQRTGTQRGAMLDAISGQAGILVGTHALLEERVRFFDLGLVVVDEQQRFGVEQRERLRAKGQSPHLLVMTATPIPRTIAMTAFGDMDTSELRELPPGRQPTETFVVPAERQRWVERSWQRVAEEVGRGHRVFVVCPRIVDSSSDGDSQAVASVEATLEDLRRTEALAALAIEAVHGQLPPAAKDAVMRRFATGETQVIVATSVVEVGVDIPQATVMVVLDAERFGVSQLHQLRGRVGRGSVGGLCLLFTSAPAGSAARERLDAVAGEPSGFALAQFDLEHRSEGDVLGTAQAGRATSLRLLRVAKDGEVIERARQHATELVTGDPALAGQPALRDAVAEITAAQQENLAKA